MASTYGGRGRKSTPEETQRLQDEALRYTYEAARVLADRATLEKRRNELRKVYKDAGFEVDTRGRLKQEPFIQVTMVEAKVDKDFYDRGDEPESTT